MPSTESNTHVATINRIPCYWLSKYTHRVDCTCGRQVAVQGAENARLMQLALEVDTYLPLAWRVGPDFSAEIADLGPR